MRTQGYVGPLLIAGALLGACSPSESADTTTPVSEQQTTSPQPVASTTTSPPTTPAPTTTTPPPTTLSPTQLAEQEVADTLAEFDREVYECLADPVECDASALLNR